MAKAAPAKKAAPVVEEQTIYAELLDAVRSANPKFKEKKPGEDFVTFCTRFCEAIANLDEEVWDEISEPAQDWNNKAVKAMNASKEPKPCPGMESDDEEPEAEEEAPAPKKGAKKAAPVVEEDEEEEPAPAPKAKGKAKPVVEEEDEEEEAPAPKKGAKAAPAPAPKGKAKPVVEDEDEEEAPAPKKAFGGKQAAPFAPKPDGITNTIRLILAKFPHYTPDQIKASLAKKGFPDAKSATINTLRTDGLAMIAAIKAAGHWKD